MIISDLSIQLILRISDPEVVEELSKHPEGLEREQYAPIALRLGTISMKYAAGQLDSVAIKQAGEGLMVSVSQNEFAKRNMQKAVQHETEKL